MSSMDEKISIVLESNHPQAIAVPPGSGRELKFLGVTHKLTRQQTGGHIIFLNRCLIPKAETASTYIASKRK